MANAALAQPGVLTDPNRFAEFLTFVLRPGAGPTAEQVADALAMVSNIRKSIGQKDADAGLSITVGFGSNGWARLFPDRPMPVELHPFVELHDGGRHAPSTPGDVFVMVKSERIDLNFQAAKYLAAAFTPVADLVDDVQGYAYLDGRDMIDFVDGTENPVNAARVDAALVDGDGPDAGGSYLMVQKYVHRSPQWDAETTESQEGVIGRTKADDIEIDDDLKQPYAHNVRSKVEIDGTEIKMYRQNRAFGNAREHGTMFVGFAASASTVETSLRQMFVADEDGAYDHLLDFTDAVTGTNYFVPPQTLLDQFS